MTVTKQIISGVAVLVIMAVGTVFVTNHIETQANTAHRLKSEVKQDEMMKLLIEIKTNQEYLIKKYDLDMKSP